MSNTAKKQNTFHGPRIYVASLGAYTAGKIHGAWIELDGKDALDVQDEIDAMLERCPVGSDEFAIHDYEGIGVDVSEHADLDDLCRLAEIISEHGDAARAYIDLVGAHYATADGFENMFRGIWDSPADYAHDLHSECGHLEDVPEALKWHIDFEGVARDMECDGVSFVRLSDGNVAVFQEG